VVGQRFETRIGQSYVENALDSYLKAGSRTVDLASYQVDV
jgi:hypothetical protein